MLKCDRWKPSPKPLEGKVGFTGGVEYKPETREIWTDVVDEWYPLVAKEHGRAHEPAKESLKGNQISMIRWREDFQNDFAARMDWCCKPYERSKPSTRSSAGSSGAVRGRLR